ncbi:MAG: hypothetical protein ABIH23_07415 [bacterium]
MITAKIQPPEGLQVMHDMAKAVPLEMAKRMLRVADYITGVIRSNAPKGRTGAVMRSFRPTVVTSKGSIFTTGSVSTLGHARVRDEGTGYLPGGAIKPKTKKNLAIPISDEAKRTVGLWPRHWAKDRLFLLKTKRGGAFLAERTGGTREDPGLIIHYKLQREVRQEGTHYIRASLPEATRIAHDELTNSVKIAITRPSRAK